MEGSFFFVGERTRHVHCVHVVVIYEVAGGEEADADPTWACSWPTLGVARTVWAYSAVGFVMQGYIILARVAHWSSVGLPDFHWPIHFYLARALCIDRRADVVDTWTTPPCESLCAQNKTPLWVYPVFVTRKVER